VTRLHNVGELIELANAISRPPSPPTVGTEKSGGALTAREFSWRDILSTARFDLAEVQPVLKPKPAIALFAYLTLRLVYFGTRVLFRMEVRGAEVLTRLKPPYLICPNHQSYIDPLLVCSNYPLSVLRNVFHVGAAMYFTNSVMASLARLINVIPIDPDLQLLRAMRAGAAGLRAGKILNIYPEGQRSFDGRLQEFKKGAAILATELSVPIVPVALDGAYRIWPRKSWRFRLAKVKISFGEPIEPRKVAPDEKDEEISYEEVTALLKERIQRMLDEMVAPIGIKKIKGRGRGYQAPG
jgi:long-chain acyl-CoA synthetase